MNHTKTLLQTFAHFCLFVIQRFNQERCAETAASLSYTSLLSLVPLMAVFFAGFSTFPVFQELFTAVQNFVFENFVPTSSEAIQSYLNEFVGKASKLTLVGLISLFVIALMLMWRIDKALNQIWGTSSVKSYLRIFLSYWAVLTLGPVFIGLSLMVTSYITSLPFITGAAELIGMSGMILKLVPILLTMSAYVLVYLIIPNARVPFLHALAGGVFATILFELSKKGFALYISNNETYSSLYGTLATIPIFLVWIYISWMVVLLGAVTTRCMDLFDFSSHGNDKKSDYHFISAFHILRVLAAASKNGVTLDEEKIILAPQLRNDKMLDGVFMLLENNHWIHKTEFGKWALSKDLDEITLWQLYNDLPYRLPDYVKDENLAEYINSSNAALAAKLDVQIKKLFTRYERD